MISLSKNVSAMTKTMKQQRKKKNGIKTNVSPMFVDFMKNEFVGNAQILNSRPRTWKSLPTVGLDKINSSSSVGKYFVDFASSSTVHGLNHLAAPHRHITERFFTAAFIGAAFVSLILISSSSWDRYQNKATIIILDRNYRYFEITKPSLILCPIIRVDEKLFPEVFKRHKIEDTPEARNFFTFIANATYANMHETPRYDKVKPEKWLTVIWELKNDPEPPLNDSRGIWIVTERGLCEAFNSYFAVYNSYTYWMQDNWTIISQPALVPKFGYEAREFAVSFNVMYAGLHVIPYHPREVPEFEVAGIYAEDKEVTKIELTITEVISSADVTSLSPSRRKCKMWSEGGLTMWPVYTHNMCILECKYQLIRKRCGCYPFFARRMPGVPVCGVIQQHCIGENRLEYMKLTAQLVHECGCYDNCDATYYRTKFTSNGKIKTGTPTGTIFNIGSEFPRSIVRREILFGLTDFMASIGGAAGLFLGCSVVSFVEIFYWATLRLFWYNINERKNKESKLIKRQTFYNKMAMRSNEMSTIPIN